MNINDYKFKILSYDEIPSIPAKKPSWGKRIILWSKGTPWIQKQWMGFIIVVDNYDQLSTGDILLIDIPELSRGLTRWAVIQKHGKYFVTGMYPETAGLIQISSTEPYLVPVLLERKLSIDSGVIVGSACMQYASELEKNGYSFETGV